MAEMTPAELLAAGNRGGKPKAPRMPSPLRSKRLAAGLTAEAVARAMGVNVMTIYRWETCATPSLADAYKMARFYGCSVYDLWPDAEAATTTEATHGG